MEAARGAAATMVVLYHASRHVDAAFSVPWLPRVFQAGHAGVDFFFVLSGFIILHAHRTDVGRPGRLPRYLTRRFVRLFPIYWCALAVALGMMVAGGHGPPPLRSLLSSIVLLPEAGPPILGVAWTLQHEVVFYAFFAALILHARAGSLLLAGWLATTVGATCLDASWLRSLGPMSGIYNIEFLMGMGAAASLPRFGLAACMACLTAGALGFAIAALAETVASLDGYGAWARVAYGGPSALLVIGLARMRARPPMGLLSLGKASYSVYLFHFAVIGLSWQLLSRTGLTAIISPLACFGVLVATGLAGGVAVSLAVEQPLLRRMRRDGPVQRATLQRREPATARNEP